MRVHSLLFAAALSILAPISAAVPALADKGAAQPLKKHYALHDDRWTMTHAHRARVAPIAGDLACGGLWCRREFVLMLGIGF